MDTSPVYQTVHARLCGADFRAKRIGALRGLATVSLLLWYQAAARVLPATVAWMLGLTAATIAALALAYGALECRWGGRARSSSRVSFAFSPGADVRDEIAAGLLSAWGILSLFPCLATLGVPVPSDLLVALSPLALSLIAVRILLEVFRPSPSRHGRASPLRAGAGRLGVR